MPPNPALRVNLGRTVVVLCAALSQFGCVGYLTQTQYHGSPKDISGSRDAFRNSKDAFRNSHAYGEPTQITPTLNGELWRYDQGSRWCGVIIYAVIIPIPLMLPLCHQATTIAFVGETATSEIHEGIEAGDHYVGLFKKYEHDFH